MTVLWDVAPCSLVETDFTEDESFNICSHWRLAVSNGSDTNKMTNYFEK